MTPLEPQTAPNMSKAEIIEFYAAMESTQNAISVTGPKSEDLDDLHAAANCDPEETAEWLPYYKLSINAMMLCAGILRSVAGKPLKAAGLRAVIEDASWYYKRSLLFSAIGPNFRNLTDRHREHIALAERERLEFIKRVELK